MLNQMSYRRSPFPATAHRESVVRAAHRAVLETLEGRQLMAGDPAIVQTLPFSLGFDADGGGITDSTGKGTGFTYVQTNKNGNEYQPGLIKLDTSRAVLELTTTGSSTTGSPIDGDNTLVNGLQTSFNAATGSFTISTRIVGPLGNLNAASEQGGLMFGPDQDNYVKLAVGTFSNGAGIQFMDEQKSGASYTHTISTADGFASIGSLANVQTLDLMISGDASSGQITGYYRLNGGGLQVISGKLALSGAQKAAFFNSDAHAGIVAMAKNNQAPVKLDFGAFGITGGTAASQLPSVRTVNPANGATKVARDIYIACDLNLVSAGLTDASVNSTTVYLYRNSDKQKVSAIVRTTGGGDAIILTPNVPLDPNTGYTFVATNGCKDASGASLVPFQMTFTTGTTGGPPDASFGFQKVALDNTTGTTFTCVRIGPDHRLYASSDDGRILRYDINSDGTLGTAKVITSLQTANGGKRLISGFTFDPSSTATDVKIWVNHGYYAVINSPNFTGKVTLMSGPDLGTVQDVVTNLPRAARDHLTEQPVFGPDGALYFCQGSLTAFGAPDAAWGNRAETLLSAAILRLDVTKVTPGNPLNAKTIDAGGKYNPYAAGAPLTLYATGVRNAFNLAWTADGHLYAANNGSAAGGNSPGFTSGDPDQVNGPRPDTGRNYAGPDVPALNNIGVAEEDYIFDIKKGKYYGHPNPARGEFVLNGGNPSNNTDTAEVSFYPVGTQPDPNFDKSGFDLGAHHSPNGIIEYRGGALNGQLEGKLLVTEYSGGSDVVVLTRDASGKIVSAQRGISGLTGYDAPINLIEDPITGNVYVAEYAGQKLVLLRPTIADARPPVPPTNAAGNGSTAGISIGWKANTEVDLVGYNVYRATSAGGPFIKLNSSLITGTSFSDAAAAVGATAYYQVTAVDGNGNESAPSAVASAFRPNDTAPNTPTGLTGSGALAGVTLSWSGNGEADLAGYNIYRSDLPDGPFEKVNDKVIKGLSFVDTDATAGMTSYYRITAINTTGNESGMSTNVSVFRPDAVPPAAPATPSPTLKGRVVNIVWVPNTEADIVGYNVYRATSATVAFIRINSSLQTTANFFDAGGSKKSWYAVTAVDSSGNESAPSVSASPGGRPRGITPPVVGGAAILSPTVVATLQPSAISGGKTKGTVVVTVANTGNAGIDGPVTINLLVSTNGTRESSDPQVATLTKKLTLMPGQSKALKLKISKLPVVSDGDYHILAEVSTLGTPTAVAASSNTIRLAAPFVDLSSQVVTTPATLTGGKTAVAVIDVTNTGNVRATGAMQVQVALSKNANGSSPVILQTVTTSIKIDPGKHKTLKLKFVPPIGATPGVFFLVTKIDPTNAFSDPTPGDHTAVGATSVTVV